MSYFAYIVAAIALIQTAPQAPPDQSHPFDRIALIGASVTWGFGNQIEVPLETYTHHDPIDLADIIDAMMLREHEIVVSGGDVAFFRTPRTSGARLAAEAVEAEPTLVLALDFLFWYGYGNRNIDSRPHTGLKSRLKLLEMGLAELDRFECPVVVFDFPDVSPAIGLMLIRSQVPSPEDLAAMNARLHEWASTRPNVILLPLHETLTQIRADEGFAIEDLQWPAGSLRTIILPDNLHPTTDGTIALAQLAVRALDNSTPAIGPDDYVRKPDQVRSRLEATAVKEAVEMGMPVKTPSTAIPEPN
ncbi:MAG: hypothetical protein CMJ24_02440 [Phycisphaerae bacterium]|nr:hypothetical protein [Phycisphaerae bacterium]|tara:strand:- start:3076 stop:3984 length:909 start_codon:yes stop_codon:yes gene_type:complete